MKQYMKWILIALLLFSLVFAVGCTKSFLEADKTTTDNGWSDEGIGYGRPVEVRSASQMAVEVDYDYAEDEYYSEKMIAPMPPYPYDDGHYGDGEDIEVDLQIIRNANIRLEVDDYFLASQKVEAFAKKYNGYVSNSNARSDYNNKKSGTVTIRIPDMHFDAVIAELSLLGDIKSKNMYGQDVTEEYIDLVARINNSQAHEGRLLAMYENATNVNQMMQVERELNRVRGQIEQNEGRLRYLKNKVSMSTITVTLYEPQPVVKQWGVWTSVKKAFNHSLATFRWMIELFGILFPLLIAGGLTWFIIHTLRRRNRVRVKRK